MPYHYDLFLSYRRNQETRTWITDHFIPLLELRVEMELGRSLSIFVDDKIETGLSWPLELGTALGCSRVLMVLWSGNYLTSKWCATELSQMLARERETGARTQHRPHGLILPAFIHDGDKFPLDLNHIQRFEIQKSFNVRMARNSPRAEELDTVLGHQARAIASAIDHAPEWKTDWATNAAQEFINKFYQANEPVQGTVPRFAG
jgi:hypothetical protein